MAERIFVERIAEELRQMAANAEEQARHAEERSVNLQIHAQALEALATHVRDGAVLDERAKMVLDIVRPIGWPTPDGFAAVNKLLGDMRSDAKKRKPRKGKGGGY